MTESRDELRALLARATTEDLERIVTALDRWPRPTGLAVSLMIAREHPDLRREVEESIVMELERAASSPLGRNARRVLGRAPRHRGLWMNFGHGHQGFTLGPVTGRLLAELMTGESPVVDAAPYRPERW